LKSMLDADILPDDPKNIDAEDAVKILASQVAQTMPGIDVEVILSDGIVSDAAAGANNIKLNQDVKFSQRELDILEVHEGWIHVGTTQNGLAQPYLTCLSKGTPSSTVTQEGLAVLTEIITLKSTPRRLAKLVNRIQGITKVIDGAEFVDIYRDYVAQGLSKDDSYTLTQRVFRGSTATGLPFTKDIAYIKGFVLVYNLIRVAIQLGRIDQLHLLLVGKISIDDFRLISQLHDLGVIEDPKFIPPHFKDLRGLAQLPETVRVIAEPGRFIVASAVTSVASVMGQAIRDGKPWYYLDDGIYGSFSGLLFDEASYPIDSFKQSNERVESVLAGPTCDSIDVVSESIMLPKLNNGDLIISRMMGAYTLATATDFNFFKRAEVIVLNDVVQVDALTG
ncbi:MAG: tyrosine/phenylalanine carboxypeptidase domain-containing protein, partial [Pseudomonadota bacterium]